MTRIVGGFFLAAFVLTLTYMAGEIGGFTLPEQLSSWSYPTLQPLGRILISVWLWRAADETKAL